MCLNKKYRGITLVETMVAAAVSTIALLAMSGLMADTQKGFNKTYDRVNCDVANDALVIRKIFSKTIRPAVTDDSLSFVSFDGTEIEVQYYSDNEVSMPDRYAKFYLADGELILEHGVVDPAETLTAQAVCENVSDVKFNINGNAAQMFLTLDDGENSEIIKAAAVMHNP